MSGKLITVYWRDIPAQVIAKKGRNSAKIPLPERFQVAIDRAAMRAGKGSSDHYLEDWRRDARACSDDLNHEAQTQAAQLDAEFNDDYLEKIIKNSGIKPE